MSPETVARLRGMGIILDEGYDFLAEELQKSRDKRKEAIKIEFIEILKTEQNIEGIIKFIVKLTISEDNAQNKIVVIIDDKEFQTYKKFNISDINVFYADVFIDFSIPRVEESFNLTTNLININSNKIIDTKFINVKVDSLGNVGESDEKLKDVRALNTTINGVSIDELKQIFNTATDDIVSDVVDAFNEGVDYFEINDCLRKAHFFAQALKEVGSGFSIKKPESLNYPSDGLKNGYWFTKGKNWIKGNNENNTGGYFKIGRKKATINFSYTKKHPEIADQYGRKDLNRYGDGGVQKANSEMLANYVYANRIGNGNPESGDGSKFRGKGLIQLTGRTNYENVNRVIQKFDKNIDILDNPDEILTDVRLAVISAMGFWKLNNINRVIGIDKSDSIVAKVTNIVNSGEDASNKKIRLNCFNNITKIVFNIKDCKL